jgi:hypothetical protein
MGRVLRVLLVLAIAALIDCVVYDGLCPAKRDFKIHRNFTCSRIFDDDENFKV